MRVRIQYTNEAGEMTLENVRWADEIAEAEGMTDAQAEAMEAELQASGRYWIDGARCAYAERSQ